MSIEVFVAALVVMLASLTGVVFVHKLARSLIEERLALLVSFSAGVFLVTAGALVMEVFHVVPSFWGGASLIILGYLAAWALQAVLPETHHHHGDECTRGRGGARRLIIGDAIHNTADGVVLASAFAVSPAIGLAATASVVIHEALQEVSEFFVLKQAGYSTKKALLVNFSVSATIFIGIFLGYFALATEVLEGVMLAFSGGFFIHVVIHDLLPRPHHHETGKEFIAHLAVVVLGAILMGLITNALSDEHGHGEPEAAATPELEWAVLNPRSPGGGGPEASLL